MIGRGNSIHYGKIQLASETEAMDNLVKHLKKILDDIGYPEKDLSEPDPDIEEAEKVFKEEMGVGDGKEEAVPGSDEPGTQGSY